MLSYEINISQVMIFRLYTIYNKYEMIQMIPRDVLQISWQSNQRKFACIVASARIILLPIACSMNSNFA